MQGKFTSGIINGKVHIFDKSHKLRAIGLYESGLPHGPFIIIINSRQVFLLNFARGQPGEFSSKNQPFFNFFAF